MVSRCKSCDAEISWVKTASGKAMPLDLPGERRFILDHMSPSLTARVAETYVSHFATCPNADQHRKAER